MKDTQHTQIKKDPFEGFTTSGYEAYAHSKGMFPTIQQM